MDRAHGWGRHGSVPGDVVKTGNSAARLSESGLAGSVSSLRRTRTAAAPQLTVAQDLQVAAEGITGGNVPLLRLFDDSGARVVSVHRQDLAKDKVHVTYGGATYLTTGLLPLGA